VQLGERYPFHRGRHDRGGTATAGTAEEQKAAAIAKSAGADASAKPPGAPGAGDGGTQPQAPAAALDACAGQAVDAACTFALDGGTLTGTCKTSHAGQLACQSEGGPGAGGGPPPKP